jgi:hypothetical protein
MRITEILFYNNDPIESYRSNPQPHLPPAPFSDDLGNLANAFTRRRGLVKYGWNINGSRDQPSGPAPPDAADELVPNGTSEPTAPSWRAGIGSFRLRHYRDVSGD